ncbi:MAG: hypothetical protein U0354_14215 [Candidatus Sericytochromatia bacterium]
MKLNKQNNEKVIKVPKPFFLKDGLVVIDDNVGNYDSTYKIKNQEDQVVYEFPKNKKDIKASFIDNWNDMWNPEKSQEIRNRIKI